MPYLRREPRYETDGEPFLWRLLRARFVPDLRVAVDEVLPLDADRMFVRMTVTAPHSAGDHRWAAVAVITFDDHDQVTHVWRLQDTAEWLFATRVVTQTEIEALLQERLTAAGPVTVEEAWALFDDVQEDTLHHLSDNGVRSPLAAMRAAIVERVLDRLPDDQRELVDRLSVSLDIRPRLRWRSLSACLVDAVWIYYADDERAGADAVFAVANEQTRDWPFTRLPWRDRDYGSLFAFRSRFFDQNPLTTFTARVDESADDGLAKWSEAALAARVLLDHEVVGLPDIASLFEGPKRQGLQHLDDSLTAIGGCWASAAVRLRFWRSACPDSSAFGAPHAAAWLEQVLPGTTPTVAATIARMVVLTLQRAGRDVTPWQVVDAMLRSAAAAGLMWAHGPSLLFD